MKLTGERPIEGKTPDSLLALHAAGYREVRDRLEAGGRFLDLGCGLADGTATFADGERVLVGIDYDATTAAQARHDKASIGLMTACSDGSALSLASDSFDYVCSSHLIEHFVEPQFHAEEVARVLSDDGTAFFITPNAPADFENPYHVYLFDPADLRQMLGRYFDDVEVIGLDATPAVKADFEKRRALARRLLALDPLGLRHKLPRSWFVALHAAGRRVAYRFMADEQGVATPASPMPSSSRPPTSTTRRSCCSRSPASPRPRSPRSYGGRPGAVQSSASMFASRRHPALSASTRHSTANRA